MAFRADTGRLNFMAFPAGGAEHRAIIQKAFHVLRLNERCTAKGNN
jgi:hypothetical protein